MLRRKSPVPETQRSIIIDRAGRRFASLSDAARCREFPGHNNFRDWAWTDGHDYWFTEDADRRNGRRVNLSGVDISKCAKNFAGEPVVEGSNPRFSFRSIEMKIYLDQLERERKLLPKPLRDDIEHHAGMIFDNAGVLCGAELDSWLIARSPEGFDGFQGGRKKTDPSMIAIRSARLRRFSPAKEREGVAPRVVAVDAEERYSNCKASCAAALDQLMFMLDSCLANCKADVRDRVKLSEKRNWKAITDAWLFRVKTDLKL